MSSEERVYTINLGKALLSQPQHRAVRAINMIREFASRHMGAADVKIDEDLAHQIWERGVRRPPRRIRVRMWSGDDGAVIVSRYDDAAPPAEPEKAGSGPADAGTGQADPAPAADSAGTDGPETPSSEAAGTEPDKADTGPAKAADPQLDKPADPQPDKAGTEPAKAADPQLDKPADPQPDKADTEPAKDDQTKTKD